MIELDSPGRHVLRCGYEDFEVMTFDQLRLAEIEAEAWLRAGRDLVAARKSAEAVSTWQFAQRHFAHQGAKRVHVRLRAFPLPCLAAVVRRRRDWQAARKALHIFRQNQVCLMGGTPCGNKVREIATVSSSSGVTYIVTGLSSEVVT